MSEVEYFHKDRHPRCCCAQCVSDEAEHEISGLRRFVLDSTSFLQAELNEQKNERVHWQQRAWIAEDKVDKLQAVVDAAKHLVSKYRDELLHRCDVDALERALEQKEVE
jgi:hypothetical protein